MKTNVARQVALRSVLVLISALTLFSFTLKPGGDSFTIYLNEKLLIQHFVLSKEKTKTISLQEASTSDVLKIHYSHCGKMGIARNLFLKDEKNRTLNSWKFENSNDGNKGAMEIRLTELTDIRKRNVNSKLSLVYSAEQLPEGVVLVHLSDNGKIEASVN